MAAFDVYEDVEDKGGREKGNIRKLKVSKFDINKRSALGEIDINHVFELKPQEPKTQYRIPKYQLKDVSEVFREVKLNSEEDKINPNEDCSKEVVSKRVPLASIEHKIDLDSSCSNISLDVSPNELDKKHSYFYRIKLHTDVLFDCHQYREDIYSYLKQLELSGRPKPFYMRKQPDITYTMRSILVDWLVEVAKEYKLQDETLFKAVSYVDRFLSTMAVVRSKLQLLGTACMFVAAKYEEIYPPEVREFTHITDNTYSKRQVFGMEQLILKTLNFEISVPTHHTFIDLLTKLVSIEFNVSNLALYICELTLVEGDPYLQFPPSLIACSAIALAKHCLGHRQAWTEKLATVSGYNFKCHLAEVLPYLNTTHSKASTMKLTASRNKYRSIKHDGASLVLHKPLTLGSNSAS